MKTKDGFVWHFWHWKESKTNKDIRCGLCLTQSSYDYAITRFPNIQHYSLDEVPAHIINECANSNFNQWIELLIL